MEIGCYIQEVSFEKENLAKVCTAAKSCGKKCKQAHETKNPQLFKIITLILRSVNIHTTKMCCKRWANGKMIF